MKSPFPGMDPFIEACDLWTDFHDNLIGDLARALSERVPRHYVVRLSARSYVAIDEDRGFPIRPDVSVQRRTGRKSTRKSRAARAREAATATLERPIVMQAPLELEQHEPFIEIYDVRPERHLVTGVEVLSPSNKRRGTPGWDEYWRKRRAFLNGAASFVEIDLLRAGSRMPMHEPWPESPYYILVARRDEAPRCEVWQAHAIQPLPKIPVPLEKHDPDVIVDLQPMVNAIYARARYAADIDYGLSVFPPLSSDEMQQLNKVKLKTGRSRRRSERGES